MEINPVTPENNQAIDYSSIATDLGLLDGERVLWTGRPIVNQPIGWPVIRRKLFVVLMLVFPSAMVYRVLNERQFDAADLVFGMIAAIWFPLAIHSLTTKPIFERWRLRRTQYVLTTRRAFVIEPQSGGRRIRFIFIDSLPAHFDRVVQPDGSGDVKIGQRIVFKQIPGALAMHQELVNAVLAARRDLPDLGWQDLPIEG
jgi:hypothetical protein